MRYFNLKNVYLSKKSYEFWDNNGYLVIEDFYGSDDCNKLIKRSKKLIDEEDLNNSSSIFDTVSQSHNDDNYFLESGDKIRFFLKKKLF